MGRLSFAPRPSQPALRPSVESPKNPLEAENARLRAELRYWRKKALELDSSVFEMRSLLQSGKGFSEFLNIDALLEAFMAVCRERCGAANSSVLLIDDLDPDNVFYRVRAHHGLPPRFMDGEETEDLFTFRLPRNQGLLWQLINQGDVFSVRDMQKLPRFSYAFRQWNLHVLKSDVWVPLTRGQEVLGILTLGEADHGAQISQKDYRFLQEIAAVAATNIDSTLKYERNERILDNLQTLYDVNQQLANVNDFKRLTKEILATAVDALGAQKANLMLVNPITQRLEIKVVWGNIPQAVRDEINSGKLETKSFAIGEGVAGQAARLKRPVRINERNRIEQVGKHVAYCLMSVPLLHGSELMGVMTLTNKLKGEGDEVELDELGRFDSDDEQLLVGLADQAATNLHKARLYDASITDRLTGLYNVRHFEEQFVDALNRSREGGTPTVLAIVDIDRFKRINDTHGHAAGDAVLVETARELSTIVRESSLDVVFRYGGEEFCILMPDTDLETAVPLLEAFRDRVRRVVTPWSTGKLSVTVSVGVVSTETVGHDPDDVFEAADQALFASKSGGRDRLTAANPNKSRTLAE